MNRTRLLTALKITILCAATGCASVNFKATKPDGTEVTIKANRFLWSTESYQAAITTNGASLNANKSNTDSATIGAVVEGAVKAATALK